MKCNRCNFGNLPDSKFCEKCGMSLTGQEERENEPTQDNSQYEYENQYYEVGEDIQESQYDELEDAKDYRNRRKFPKAKRVYMSIAILLIVVGIGSTGVFAYKYHQMKQEEKANQERIAKEETGDEKQDEISTKADSKTKEQGEMQSEEDEKIKKDREKEREERRKRREEESGATSRETSGGESRATETVSEELGEYILPESNTRVITHADIRGLTSSEIRYAKNEIYARRGRKFSDSELQEYFNGKDWYHGTVEPDAFDEAVFNSIEKQNVEFLATNE